MATMVQAVRLALHVGEQHLGVTDVFGQDVGPPLGGVFTATQGLRTAWNTPLDERGTVGMAIGLAMAGQRPVAEIQFSDYAYNTIDLLKLAGNTHWSSNGDWNVPLVLMTPVGAGIHGGVYHSHSFDAQATRIPGWKIVMPSRPLDAYGLMLSAIKDPNPVMVLLPKALMRVKASPHELLPGEPPDARELSRLIDAPLGDRTGWSPRWPQMRDESLPIGKARTVRPGHDITVVTYGRLVPMVEEAARKLATEQIDVEIVDLRSLHPYDWTAVDQSVRKTRRLLVANEDTEITNFGEHLIRRAAEELFELLLTHPRLHAARHVPGIGIAPALEQATVPTVTSLVEAIRSTAVTTVDRATSTRRSSRPPRPISVPPRPRVDAGGSGLDMQDVLGRLYGDP